MPSQTKELLEQIILLKSLGDPILQKMTRIKLRIKGISLDDFDDDSPDDPDMIDKLCQIADDLGLHSEYIEQFKKRSGNAQIPN